MTRVDWDTFEMVVGCPGKEERFKLCKGDEGFLTFARKGAMVPTEVSNAMLELREAGKKAAARKAEQKAKEDKSKKKNAPKKRPSAAKKRPAAAGAAKCKSKKRKRNADDDDGDDDDDDDADEDDDDDDSDEDEDASDEPEDAAEPGEEPAAAPAAAVIPGRAYGAEYYKNSHTIGIRRRHGTKGNVCSFGGKAYWDVTEEKMKDVGRDICKLIQDGRFREEDKQAIRDEGNRMLKNFVNLE